MKTLHLVYLIAFGWSVGGGLGCQQKMSQHEAVRISPAKNNTGADAMGDDQTDGTPAQLLTDRKKLSDAVVVAPEKKEAGTIAVEAERGALLGQMKVTKLDTASGGGYVSVANVDPDTDSVRDVEASTDILRVKFNVKDAGDYRLFIKASAPTEDDNAIFVTVDRGINFLEVEAPLTADNQFVWSAVDPGGDPISLLAGEYIVEFRRLESGLKIDAVAISSNPTFTGTDIITADEVKALKFDIAKLCNTSAATLEIEVAQLKGAYSFRNLKVVSEKPLALKSVSFGLNGLINPTFSTFASIDAKIEANQTSPISSDELVVPAANGPDADDFSLQFETCSEQ